MNLMRLAVFVAVGAAVGITAGAMLHQFVLCFAFGTSAGAALGVVFATQSGGSGVDRR